MSAVKPGVRRPASHVVEVTSTNADDLSRARALVGMVESLSPIVRESLCSSVQLPVDLRTESGELSSIVVHPAWSRKRESLRASGTPWSQCAESEIRGQCVIDMLDTYATMLGSGALMSGRPPVIRPVVDGAPRMLIGDAPWLISAEPWSGGTGLPLGMSRRDAIPVVAALLEEHAAAVDSQFRECLIRNIREARNTSLSQEEPMEFLRRLARELRHSRSEAAKTAAFLSASGSKSSTILEREVGDDQELAERLLGKDVVRALRDQRALEKALEAREGADRRNDERVARATPRSGSQWFDLDLRPPGEGVVESPEPLDLDRRFVLGQMDWIVSRLKRGELDLANARIATTARVALEELLAATDAPRVVPTKGRWNSLERMWAYSLEASALDDRLATHVSIRIMIDGESDEHLVPLPWASDQGVRVVSIALRLPPNSELKVSGSLVWSRDGLLVAGQYGDPEHDTTPRQPSEFASTLNNLRGGDETDESPEMRNLVARSRRRAFRVAAACVGSVALALLTYLLWGDITELLAWFWGLFSDSGGEIVVDRVVDETGV